MDFDIDELEVIMFDGACEATREVCGHTDTIEPDGDYECPECGEGRLTSPLIIMEMI